MFDESQPEPIVAPNTENQTTFYGDDKEANYDGVYRLDGSRKFKNHYDRLSKHNRGVVGEWFDRAECRRDENLQIFDAIANFLELPKYQHNIARTEFKQVSLRDWSSPNGIDVFLIATLICAVVCLKDPRFERAYNPDRNPTSNDDLFLQFFENVPYRESEIRSCYQKALRHVDWEPTDWTNYKNE
jgi:hypothetical protein